MYVVTGLTRMSPGRICMSVYDTVLNRYLRPIPPNGKYSDEDLQDLSLFSVVILIADIRAHTIHAPHSEDFPVTNQHLEPVRLLTTREQLTLLRRISLHSPYDVFGFRNQEPILKQRGIRYYVLPGTGSYSLGTVVVEQVRLFFNNYDKLRVNFRDIAGHTFSDVSFVSINEDDPDEVNYRLRRCQSKFLRVSLARKLLATNWDHEACFLQVSCIHGY